MRVVVLGTGTNVGKTFVTACLARSLRAAGVATLALKPIESGVDEVSAGDAGSIAAAAGHPPALSRWRFADPVSPHLAARRAGTLLDEQQVADWVRDQERVAAPQVSLVELAGGAFSPIRPGGFNVDLALALLPAIWILVAPDSLGVLHDVRATLLALPRPIDALVLSCARASDESTGTNAAELGTLGIASVLERLAPGAAHADVTAAWLRAHPSFTSAR